MSLYNRKVVTRGVEAVEKMSKEEERENGRKGTSSRRNKVW